MITDDRFYSNQAEVKPDRPVLSESTADLGEKAAVTAASRRRVRDPSQDWLAALLFLGLDVGVWIAIYALFSFLRHDAFFTTPLQFAVVDLIQLVTIVVALFIISAYNRHTDMRTLSFTTEYILALISAAVLSALLIYSAATYDQSMNPSRAVMLLSFIVFTPISLGYRRLIGSYMLESTAARTFLVIGSGPAAVGFYEAYRGSGNRQRLEFIDLASHR